MEGIWHAKKLAAVGKNLSTLRWDSRFMHISSPCYVTMILESLGTKSHALGYQPIFWEISRSYVLDRLPDLCWLQGPYSRSGKILLLAGIGRSHVEISRSHGRKHGASAWFRTDCPCFCEPRCALQMLWLQDLYFSNKNTKLKPEAKARSLCSRPLSSKKIPWLICHHYFLCGMFPACFRRAHCNKHSSAGSWLMTASELHS